MDYIPVPLNPHGAPLTVPLLSSTSYDESISFEDYPEHEGWGKRTVADWTAVFENPTPEFQAFLQRWLLFGPLQAFSASEFDTSRITHVNPDTGETELTLSMLPRFAERMLTSTPEEVLTISIKACDILGAAIHVQQILTTPNSEDEKGLDSWDDTEQYTLQRFISQSRKDPSHPLVSIAISSMLTFINTALLRAMVKVMDHATSDFALNGHTMVFEGRSPIWAELVRRGWCPFELSPMSARFDTAGLAFMCRVERPIPWKTHKTATYNPWTGGSSDQDTQLCSSSTLR